MSTSPKTPPTWPAGHALYRQFLEDCADEMYVHDIQGVLLDVNQAACRNLGYTREELLGMRTIDLSAQRSLEELQALWHSHAPGLNLVEPNIHRRKDASTYPVDVHITCQLLDGQKYFLAMARDARDKLQREQTMREHNEQLEAAVQQRTRQWQESNRLMEAVMQQTPDAVFIKDLQGRYVYGNAALSNYLGHPLSSIVGQSDQAFFSPEDSQMNQSTDRLTLERNEAWTFEERLHVQGQPTTFHLMKTPYRDEAGAVIGLLGMARNITEMRKTQDLVTHNYEMLRQAERIANIGSWTLDLTTGTFTASEMLTEMNGLTPSDPPLTPEGLQVMIPPEQHALLTVAINNCIAHGTPYSLDVQHKRPQGGFFPCRIRGQAYRSPKGDIIMLHGTLQDLSEHMEAQERLQSLADNLPNGAIFRCEQPNGDGHMVLTYVSAGIQNLLGHSASTFLAEQNTFPKALHPEDMAAYRALVLQCLRTQLPLDTVCRVRHTNGELRWMRVRAVPRATHESLLWEGLLLDVTQEYEAQKALHLAKEAAESAEKAKSEFLATMSHEIRTPMNTVIGMTQLLLQTQMAPKQRNYLDKVARSASALLSIINDILDFSKLEADMLSLVEESFLLDELLETISAVTSLTAEQKGIEIIYAVDSSVPSPLYGDVQRLSQVLTNLVGNALKFTERGEVVVTLRATPAPQPPHTHVLHVSVRDTGIGMQPELLDQLFRPFTQAEAHISRRYGGTGLGLAISRKLIELMGGHITVASEPGVGSTFSFDVPLRGEERSQAAKTIDVEHCRVLVVDDNPVAREILSTMVLDFGLECQTASSGPEALEQLGQASAQAQPYHMVLMDWRMPGMDGLEVAERIRRHDRLASTPAMLMVTAYCRDEVLERVTQLGLQGLLIKPVTESALFNALQDALHAHNPGGVQLRRDHGQRMLKIPSSLQGRRVLVVDDNALNREVAHDILQLAHMQITTCSSGHDALAWLERESFEVVLLDVQMPDMDGLEVARRIRLQEPLKNLPVLALTAQARPEDRQAILQSGMNGHLTKPLDAQALFVGLCDALGCSSTDLQPPLPNALNMPSSDTGIRLEFAGDPERRQRLLRAFVRDFATAPAQLLTLQASQDWQALGLLAHTLKGSIGYLQQPAAVRAMEAVETACRNGPVPATATAAASRILQTVLDQVQASLHSLPTPSSDTAASAPLPVNTLRHWVQQALPAIESGDYAGVQLLEKIENLLRGHDLHGLAVGALALTEDLENEAASQMLQQILTALATHSPPGETA